VTTSDVIEVDDLHKSYRDRAVLRGVTFRVAEGEVLGILGPNGAGKTTTVECLQGLRRPDRGRLRVLGFDPQHRPDELRRLVGSQLQDAALPDRLRVGEAVRLFGPCKVDPDAALAPWGLVEQRRTAFGDLSGGQRQRLFIALALLGRPRLVFLDELTQGLDPTARREVWEAVRAIRSGGTTVVLVTHFLDEAEALCDRLVVIGGGRVVTEGTPADIARRSGGSTTVSWDSTDPAAPAAADRIPGVRAVRFDGRRVEVDGDESVVAHVGAALVGAGCTPALRVRHPGLEDALEQHYRTEDR
jgi:ABC-2 type transport system ATP-binding protein